MPTQKRRVIYLSDEDWAELRKRAAWHKTSASALIRDLLVYDEAGHGMTDTDHPAWPAFNSRGSRPVPKGK